MGKAKFAFCVAGLFFVPGSHCAAAQYQTQSFPGPHEVFAPLQADPTELQFKFQLGFPVSQQGIALVDVGDYLGVYRWAIGSDGAVQINAGGSVNSRFDATVGHNLQVIDYTGNVPIDLRLGWFSSRSMFYHDSSHLGDDYLRVRHIEDQNNSWNALREIMAVDPWKALRLYGGYIWSLGSKPGWAGRNAVQGGAEIYFNTAEHGFWHPYWANDLQSWQRSRWNVTWTSQLGFRTGDRFSNGRGISYFVQFQTGPRYEGQFFASKETIWGVGLKFFISDHLFQPAGRPNPSR